MRPGKGLAAVAVAIWLAQGCASTKPEDDTPCPSNIADFEAGQATADKVKRCLGTPSHEDYNDDGRFVYLYALKSDIILSYLFDSDGVLVRIRGYEQR